MITQARLGRLTNGKCPVKALAPLPVLYAPPPAGVFKLYYPFKIINAHTVIANQAAVSATYTLIIDRLFQLPRNRFIVLHVTENAAKHIIVKTNVSIIILSQQSSRVPISALVAFLHN